MTRAISFMLLPALLLAVACLDPRALRVHAAEDRAVVSSSIIASAGSVVLSNGNGDVSATGAMWARLALKRSCDLSCSWQQRPRCVHAVCSAWCKHTLMNVARAACHWLPAGCQRNLGLRCPLQCMQPCTRRTSLFHMPLFHVSQLEACLPNMMHAAMRRCLCE